MPVQTVGHSQISVATYAGLRRLIRQTLLEGRRKIEQAKVETYWQTGKYIHGHILHHQDRAEYGKQVIQKLAADLEVGERVLYQTHQFYQAFPILHRGAKSLPWDLRWSHYRALITVPDEKQRLALVDLAARKAWTAEELRRKIRQEMPGTNGRAFASAIPAKAGIHSVLPTVALGPFYTYKIIRPETIHRKEKERLIDLGFGHTLELDALTSRRFPDGTIVSSLKAPAGRYRLEKYPLNASSAAPESDLLYTYKAYVEKVIDGDTLAVEFQLGFGNRKRETIRLNHVNCPELRESGGERAKLFVEAQLAPCEFITIKSVKTRKEKWGRYLGDIFFEREGGGGPVYLNQLLLDKGHAVRAKR